MLSKNAGAEMSEWVKVKSRDGFELDAYVSKPDGEPIGALVVIQEIFGVNKHIQSVVDGYAKDGFYVISPATFDRVEKGLQLDYTPDGWKKAMESMNKLDKEKAVEDIGATVEYARAATGKKVATLGFCLGGLLSWVSAAKLPIDAAVGYYAGGIGNYADLTPKVPVLLHFGSKDDHIPEEQVDKVAKAHPEVQIFWYDAGHAFNRDLDPASYDAASAKLARERSLEFLKKNLV
jgi:carboxymethylenebutenolidase